MHGERRKQEERNIQTRKYCSPSCFLSKLVFLPDPCVFVAACTQTVLKRGRYQKTKMWAWNDDLWRHIFSIPCLEKTARAITFEKKCDGKNREVSRSNFETRSIEEGERKNPELCMHNWSEFDSLPKKQMLGSRLRPPLLPADRLDCFVNLKEAITVFERIGLSLGRRGRKRLRPGRSNFPGIHKINYQYKKYGFALVLNDCNDSSCCYWKSTRWFLLIISLYFFTKKW